MLHLKPGCCPRALVAEDAPGAWSRLLELLVWGATYDVESVVQDCELELWSRVTEANVCTVLRVADHHGCTLATPKPPSTINPILEP